MRRTILLVLFELKYTMRTALFTPSDAEASTCQLRHFRWEKATRAFAWHFLRSLKASPTTTIQSFQSTIFGELHLIMGLSNTKTGESATTASDRRSFKITNFCVCNDLFECYQKNLFCDVVLIADDGKRWANKNCSFTEMALISRCFTIWILGFRRIETFCMQPTTILKRCSQQN